MDDINTIFHTVFNEYCLAVYYSGRIHHPVTVSLYYRNNLREYLRWHLCYYLYFFIFVIRQASPFFSFLRVVIAIIALLISSLLLTIAFCQLLIWSIFNHLCNFVAIMRLVMCQFDVALCYFAVALCQFFYCFVLILLLLCANFMLLCANFAVALC